VCARALAVCEIIAALRNRPQEDLPPEAATWVAAHSDLDVSRLIPLSVETIEYIGREGELYDLWEETEDLQEWQQNLKELTSRINS